MSLRGGGEKRERRGDSFKKQNKKKGRRLLVPAHRPKPLGHGPPRHRLSCRSRDLPPHGRGRSPGGRRRRRLGRRPGLGPSRVGRQEVFRRGTARRPIVSLFFFFFFFVVVFVLRGRCQWEEGCDAAAASGRRGRAQGAARAAAGIPFGSGGVCRRSSCFCFCSFSFFFLQHQ